MLSVLNYIKISMVDDAIYDMILNVHNYIHNANTYNLQYKNISIILDIL